jgi:hypothetical protein
MMCRPLVVEGGLLPMLHRTINPHQPLLQMQHGSHPQHPHPHKKWSLHQRTETETQQTNPQSILTCGQSS